MWVTNTWTPQSVDWVNIDLVNADVSIDHADVSTDHADVSTDRPLADVMLTSA